METIQTISEKKRRYRQEQGLTLDEFAGITGMNKGNLSKIENGKLGIGMPVLLRLLNALDCRMEIFPSSLKSTVRFYRNISTVYRLTEDNGMDYLCTLPALKERLISMVGQGHTFLVDMPCKDAIPIRIDGKSYYTYTIDGLIGEAQKMSSLPPLQIRYKTEQFPGNIGIRTIRLKCMTLHG